MGNKLRTIMLIFSGAFCMILFQSKFAVDEAFVALDDPCSGCHGGRFAEGDIGGEISLTGLPSVIESGKNYSISVSISKEIGRINDDSTRFGGFQLIALDNQNSSLGRFSNPSNNGKIVTRGQFRTFESDNAQDFSLSNKIEWDANWNVSSQTSSEVKFKLMGVIGENGPASNYDSTDSPLPISWVLPEAQKPLELIIPVRDPIDIVLDNQAPNSCLFNNSGSLEVRISGGQRPYQINWSDGGTSTSRSNLAPGNYTVTVTDINDFTATETFTITSTAGPEIVLINKTDTDCAGNETGAISIRVDRAQSPIQYEWSNGATTQNVSNLRLGTYTVSITDGNGCIASRTFFIGQPSDIRLNIQTTPETAAGAENGSAIVTATGGNPPYQYQWSNGGGGQAITNLGSGNYEVTVTDASGCSEVESFVISTIASGDIKFYHQTIQDVSSDWQVITLPHSYDSPVIIATPKIGSIAQLPVVTRIRNAMDNQFELKVQNPAGNDVTGYTVSFVVVEEGSYTMETHGVKLDAFKVMSEKTTTRNKLEIEKRDYPQEYWVPVVLGQVMTTNDEDWSVFYAHGNHRAVYPNKSLFAGKHVGEDPNTDRENEMLGVIIMEQGHYDFSGTHIMIGRSGDFIRGVGFLRQYGANIKHAWFDEVEGAVLSSSGLDEMDMGWPVLYGEQTFAPNSVRVAIDEDDAKRNERIHYTEQIAFLFAGTWDAVGPRANNGASETELKVFPNPTTEQVSIYIPDLELNEQVDFEFNDINGKIIPREVVKVSDTKFQTDFSQLTSGVYFIKIKRPNRRDQVMKILVQGL